MTDLATRRAALEARLTRGYAWFVAHGYEPTTATGDEEAAWRRSSMNW